MDRGKLHGQERARPADGSRAAARRERDTVPPTRFVGRKHAGFLNLYAAGMYPYQCKGGDCLPKWTAADCPLDNRDVVL